MSSENLYLKLRFTFVQEEILFDSILVFRHVTLKIRILKENVILGHLVPAGTGFRTHQQAEVRIRPEALEALAEEKQRILAARQALLDGEVAGAVGQDVMAVPRVTNREEPRPTSSEG